MTARANVGALAVLGAVAVGSWIALGVTSGEMPMGAAAFLGGWTLMMTAMMVPSTAPLVLVHPKPGRASLIVGYLAVWAAVGIPVLVLARVVDLMEVPTAVAAAILVGAAVYQLTPLKDACLRECRSPLDFLAQRFGRSPFQLGVEHGAYCVGCCWALMAVLVVAGAMALAWAAVIALVVFVEKVVPRGDVAARVGGGALLVTAIAISI